MVINYLLTGMILQAPRIFTRLGSEFQAKPSFETSIRYTSRYIPPRKLTAGTCKSPRNEKDNHLPNLHFCVKHVMATLRSLLKVKLLVFLVGYMQNPTKLKGAKGIRRSPKMCQEMLGFGGVNFNLGDLDFACIRWLEKHQKIFPKWWRKMVIHHGRIRKKSPKEQIQGIGNCVKLHIHVPFMFPNIDSLILLKSHGPKHHLETQQTHTHKKRLGCHRKLVGGFNPSEE